MDSSPIVLLILFCLFIVVGCILAFIAFAATRRIESTLESLPLNELIRRVYKLEQQLAQLQKLASSAPPSTPSSIPVPPSAPSAVPPEPAPVYPQVIAAPLPHPPAAPSPSSVRPRELTTIPPHLRPPVFKEPSADDLEALIGGRWFNRIGIIALLFAVSYFLKLAFDNNWIGPAGRVTIGIILGAVMLPWSEWLLRRDYSYFSEGIAGLGEATLFVSVWAGCQYYTLFSRQTGFVALVFVTAIMAFLALRRDSPRIAFLSLLGGLLAPALMSSGKNEQIMLFSYLLCLGGAALAVSWRRSWQALLPLSFVGTHLYFWQWYDMFYSRGLFLQRTVLFVTFFFVLYSTIPVLRAVRRSALTSMDLLLVAANAAAYAGSLSVMLWPDSRVLLAALFLLLALFHAAVALLFQESGSLFSRVAYLILAVAFFTLAIPIRFDGNTVTILLAIEGSVLAWIGFRYQGGLLRPAGYFLILAAAFRLLVFSPHAGTFLWNDRFGSYLVLVACLVAPLWVAVSSRSDEGTAPYPPPLVTSPVSSSDSSASEIAFLSIAANFFALLALTFEFWDYLGHGRIVRDHSLAQNLSISILWTVYAAALIVFGLLLRSGLLRWQSLVLLGIVVAKVFFLDLSSLDRAYRIASFFILGMVLLAVSFAYQRKQSRPAS